MRIGHWQLECIPGDVQANMGKVVERLAEATDAGLEVVSFPESMLTGYYRDGDLAAAHALEASGPEIASLLQQTASLSPTFMVGFNELRGGTLFNTVMIAKQGVCLGLYSKAFPCFSYFTPGREFPVFRHEQIPFGVIICADGGYIEPARILAIKGAELIFAPHFNYIAKENLISHFMRVRADHTARACENAVWFLRGNNVCRGTDDGLGFDGVGYGDSYLIDPDGEIVVRTARHVEALLMADITPGSTPQLARRSQMSAAALGGTLAGLIPDAPL